MPDLGLDAPSGLTLASYEERPDLIRAASVFNGSVWPEFMLQDAPIHIDREADQGVYYDPNVWVVHAIE